MYTNNYAAVYSLLKDLKSWEFIDLLTLSSQDIVAIYSSFYIDVEKKPRDVYVEKKLNPPSLVTYFYFYIYINGRIPDQHEYTEFYFLMNEKWLKSYVPQGKINAFKGRLSRFYTSMLRDFHFYHLLKESQSFQDVLYVLKYDIEGKIDLFVRAHSVWYGLQLRTNTRNSEEFYKKKVYRNPIPTKAHLIDMPIDLKTCERIKTQNHDLMIYSKQHIEYIIEIIGRH